MLFRAPSTPDLELALDVMRHTPDPPGHLALGMALAASGCLLALAAMDAPAGSSRAPRTPVSTRHSIDSHLVSRRGDERRGLELGLGVWNGIDSERSVEKERVDRIGSDVTSLPSLIPTSDF
jgi:hypothetical protein